MDDLVTAEDIAAALGVTRQLVHYWRTDLDGFPAPARRLGIKQKQKGVYIWTRGEVEKWAARTGRPCNWPTADD